MKQSLKLYFLLIVVSSFLVFSKEITVSIKKAIKTEKSSAKQDKSNDSDDNLAEEEDLSEEESSKEEKDEKTEDSKFHDFYVFELPVQHYSLIQHYFKYTINHTNPHIPVEVKPPLV